MKFTLSWLKEHLDTDAEPDEIAERLTAVGLEVEEVIDRARDLAPFKVARVVSAEPHPNADKLRVCRVETEMGEVQVVCGAPNARAGMLGVFAPVGAAIPGTGLVLKPTEIRGVASEGMLVSEREMGLSDEHDGIIEMPEGSPVGAAFAALRGLADPVFDVAVTPNRPDCFGVRGIARDLAASGLGALKEDRAPRIEGGFDNPVAIALEFAEDEASACPAFAGRLVRGVTNGPSPDWLKKRLEAVGLRPINVLVDITNYLSLDRARPLHVYDAAKLQGAVRARPGRAGESFLALDGKTYAVDAEMCVIADDAKVLGLGGVMGGEETGAGEATRDVFIESALFDPLRTARTGRRTGIVSDARQRFERGVDPQSVLDGLDRATRMVLDLAGGEASRATLAGAIPETDRIVEFPLAEVKRLTGLDLDPREVKARLTALGFWVSGSGETVKVAVPSWRPDVEGKADLVEEVTRLAGLDRVRAVALPRPDGVTRPVLTPMQTRLRLARRHLAARGFVEAVTWSFIARAQAQAFGGGAQELALANPISEDMSDMRPSLLPGLVAAGRRNADRGHGDLALFEAGAAYLGDRPEDQKTMICGVRRGTARHEGAGRHWSGPARPVSVFDAKEDALAVLAEIGAPVDAVQVERGAPDWYHPGRSGLVKLGPKTVLARFGELHPDALAALDTEGPHAAFEIFLDAVPLPKARAGRARPALDLASLMPVRRDFAFLVGRDVPAGDIVRAARGAEKSLVTAVSVFDLFEGAALGEGRKSVAIEVTLQPKAKTLTDQEIEAVSARIVGAVEKATGGVLRG